MQDTNEDSFQKYYDFLETSINKIEVQRPYKLRSPFMWFYLQSFTLNKMKKDPESNNKELTKKVAEQWKGMSANQKKKYNDIYNRSLQIYKQLINQYNSLKKSRKKISAYFLFEKQKRAGKRFDATDNRQIAKKLSEQWKSIGIDQHKHYSEEAQVINLVNKRFQEQRQEHLNKYIIQSRKFRKQQQEMKKEFVRHIKSKAHNQKMKSNVAMLKSKANDQLKIKKQRKGKTQVFLEDVEDVGLEHPVQINLPEQKKESKSRKSKSKQVQKHEDKSKGKKDIEGKKDIDEGVHKQTQFKFIRSTRSQVKQIVIAPQSEQLPTRDRGTAKKGSKMPLDLSSKKPEPEKPVTPAQQVDSQSQKVVKKPKQVKQELTKKRRLKFKTTKPKQRRVLRTSPRISKKK